MADFNYCLDQVRINKGCKELETGITAKLEFPLAQLIWDQEKKEHLRKKKSGSASSLKEKKKKKKKLDMHRILDKKLSESEWNFFFLGEKIKK